MSPTVIALCVVAAAATMHVLVPRLVLQQQRRRLAVVCRERRVIAITFDDGPGRLLTPLLARRLADSQVPATFFLLGTNVRGNEDIVEDLVRQGHEIGSHGHGHVHHVWSWPWAGIVDTSRGRRRLRDVIGGPEQSIPFRPPFGKLNILSLLWVWWKRTPVAMWTHDGFDTRLGVDKTPAALAESLRRDGGGVVLLHDFDRSLPNAGQQVLAKLDAVLRLQDEGFRFVRCRELLP